MSLGDGAFSWLGTLPAPEMVQLYPGWGLMPREPSPDLRNMTFIQFYQVLTGIANIFQHHFFVAGVSRAFSVPAGTVEHKHFLL